jgi:hypothetical protein
MVRLSAVSRFAVAFVLAAQIAACGGSHSAAVHVKEHAWNFIGRVGRVEFDKGYDWQPKTIAMAGAPEIGGKATFTVGPETIVLTDGRVLHVPARTPGANACVELMTNANKLAVTGFPPPEGLRDAAVRNYGPRNKFCVIIGSVVDGVVHRFSVVSDDTSALANVGALASARAGSYLTTSGYRFRFDAHIGGKCGPANISPKKLLSGAQLHEALVNPASGTIVTINCFYRL